MKKTVLLYNGGGAAFRSNIDDIPSISLMALSAFLKKNGYETRLLLNTFSDSELKELMRDTTAVGFSVLTGNGINQSLKIARRIRSACSEVPLVWGGYHPTLKPEQTLKHDLVDYVVRGEGEHTFTELLSALSDPQRALWREIKGLSYKNGNQIIHNEDRTASDLQTYPLMDFSLYDSVFKQSGEVVYMSSRGCPFDCRFCCNAAFNRNHGLKFRQLPMERVVDDLGVIVSAYDPKIVFFWDDLFLSTPSRIKQFIKGYRDGGFAFKWIAYFRCDVFARLEDDIIRDLKKINPKKLYFGAESGSESILQMTRKRINVADIIRAAEKLRRMGLDADFSFMNGFPNETKDDVLKSLELRSRIKTLLPNSTVTFFVYTPLPGTEMLEDCEALGYKEPADLEGWAEHDYRAFDPPWASDSHSRLNRNISYASLSDSYPIEGGLLSPRNLTLRCLRRTSRWRLNHMKLGFAPEIDIVSALHHRIRVR